jgi:hypothetical protein
MHCIVTECKCHLEQPKPRAYPTGCPSLNMSPYSYEKGHRNGTLSKGTAVLQQTFQVPPIFCRLDRLQFGSYSIARKHKTVVLQPRFYFETWSTHISHSEHWFLGNSVERFSSYIKEKAISPFIKENSLMLPRETISVLSKNHMK